MSPVVVNCWPLYGELNLSRALIGKEASGGLKLTAIVYPKKAGLSKRIGDLDGNRYHRVGIRMALIPQPLLPILGEGEPDLR
jgi:hypothetical protein